MIIDRNNIDQYVERFFDGKTSRQEEEAIYHYFATERIPRHLCRYKAMFAWYADKMPYDPTTALAIKQKRREKIIFWSAAATIAIIVASLSFALVNNYSALQHEYQIYEGSYVEINGRRIEDLHIILPQIHKIESQCKHIAMSFDINNDSRYAAFHSEAARILAESDNIEQTIKK